ncbi:xylulokinase [Arachnia propionica]|uniref:xylulokinase n=1 Tax=Arachnia propionica TaxID=1750 RepID=UPI000F6F3688|nr:FGGY family carbohydrate kinase [Arachnia propionica]VEJ59569.1 Autoinducer 2 kinase LsrK [Arachnia propionica]
MSARYLLGIDVGTTAIKAAVFDTDGIEVGSFTAEYTLLTPRAGQVELDVETYVTTFALAVRGALQEAAVPASEIAVLGLSAQGETFCCLDNDNQPIGRAIVWMDTRAAAEAEIIEEHFGRPTLQTTTGQVSMDSIYPAAKLLWLRTHEPKRFQNTAKFALLKDYLVYRMTGRLTSEDSLLCTTMLWDINTRRWWPEMLDYLGITPEQLPEIAPQGDIVGLLTASAAAELGLPAGLPVSVGALDQACGALGIGNAEPGIFSESTGSALTSVTITDELTLDPAGRVPCFPSAIAGQYMLHCFSTGGMVMRWYRDNFCSSEMQVESLCGINAYYLIDQEVAQVEPGCEGLIVLPHLQGSGPPDLDAYARGTIFGLTLAHKKQHLSRGVMEGVTMVLRRMIEATAQLGIKVSEIISLSGGAKSAAWCQIKSDATGLPLRTLLSAESAACRGAALIAAVGAGLIESAAPIARQSIDFDRSYQPNPQHTKTYDELFERYGMLEKALKPLLKPAEAAG